VRSAHTAVPYLVLRLTEKERTLPFPMANARGADGHAVSGHLGLQCGASHVAAGCPAASV
jgi:hypothetical protein